MRAELETHGSCSMLMNLFFYADELVRLGCGGFVQGMVMAVNWRGLKVNWKKTKLLVTGGEAGEAV